MKFCRSIEKDHAWKDSGVMTQGRRELEVGTLLLSKDKNNVISKNALFSVLKLKVWSIGHSFWN